MILELSFLKGTQIQTKARYVETEITLGCVAVSFNTTSFLFLSALVKLSNFAYSTYSRAGDYSTTQHPQYSTMVTQSLLWCVFSFIREIAILVTHNHWIQTELIQVLCCTAG